MPSQNNKKLNLTHERLRVPVDMTLRRLRFTGTTRTFGIKYYWKQNIPAIFGTRQGRYHHILRTVFTWYCTI